MADYNVFGGILRSAISFDDSLPRIGPGRGEAPTWRFERGTQPDPLGSPPIGEDAVAPGVVLRLYRSVERFRLDYGHIGSFDAFPADGSIVWYPGVHDCEYCAKQCVLGRVLALLIHGRAGYCLHASSVAFGDDAVAFVAPKGTGKSTLATQLVARGAALVTDDMLRVEVGEDARAHSGVQRLRLWPDSAAAAADFGFELTSGSDGKLVSRPVRAVPPRDYRLRAIYLVQQVDAGEPAAARREPLLGAPAALALIPHFMLGRLIYGGADALRAAAAISSVVPIFVLTIRRGYSNLEEVAGEVARWHGFTSLSPAIAAPRDPEAPLAVTASEPSGHPFVGGP